MVEREIAKITRTFLGVEGHGIWTAQVDLDYGGAGQSCGGYALDAPTHDADGKFAGRAGTAFGMEWIRRFVAACGVDSWEQVVGRTVYAVRDGGPVIGIEPLPTERGKTFMFADLSGN